MNQMTYQAAKPLLDNGKAIIVKIQPEVGFGFGWLATIKVDSKHDYLVTLSAAQKLALKEKLH